MSDSMPYTVHLPSPAQPLFILAMDHRASFARHVFGISGEPTAEQRSAMQDAKSLIFAAARRVSASRAHGGHLGILVDEQLGADVARAARDAGFQLAMPVEVSGSDRFAFEYGDDFAAHVERFNPDWVKALVRFNPADATDVQVAQIASLRRLHEWTVSTRRNWMIELLVPATPAQLAAHKDQAGYDANLRPTLTAQVIGTLAAAGVHPTIWKLEGYEDVKGARQVLNAVDATGVPSCCIVLGRNAPVDQVDRWLDVAGSLQGFAGFAVGRSIWQDPLSDYLGGRADRDTTESSIAERYSGFIDRYLSAEEAPAGPSGKGTVRQFDYDQPRLTPDREAAIRQSVSDARSDGQLPAWMVMSLLAEVDALRADP